jgi:hypothetical protein
MRCARRVRDRDRHHSEDMASRESPPRERYAGCDPILTRRSLGRSRRRRRNAASRSLENGGRRRPRRGDRPHPPYDSVRAPPGQERGKTFVLDRRWRRPSGDLKCCGNRPSGWVPWSSSGDGLRWRSASRLPVLCPQAPRRGRPGNRCSAVRHTTQPPPRRGFTCRTRQPARAYSSSGSCWLRQQCLRDGRLLRDRPGRGSAMGIWLTRRIDATKLMRAAGYAISSRQWFLVTKTVLTS